MLATTTRLPCRSSFFAERVARFAKKRDVSLNVAARARRVANDRRLMMHAFAGLNWAQLVQALAALIAAVAGSVALWLNAMPFCDMYDLEVKEAPDDDGVRLRCGVKNSGNGPAFRVNVWLLEYGRIRKLPHSQHCIGPLGAREHYVGRTDADGKTDPLFTSDLRY
jgi:hypothetical protein